MELTLSQAIKAGAKLGPQAFGRLRDQFYGGDSVATCALGAALEGAMVLGAKQSAVVGDLFPLLDKPAGPLPCGCPFGAMRMMDAVTHLNDRHRWPRERIAAWVRHIEKK